MSEPLSEVGPVEAVADPVAPEPVADDLAGDGATDDTTAIQAAAPEAPAIDPAELQAELEYTRGQLSELAAYLQQQEGQQPGAAPQQPGQPDLSAYVDEFGQITPEGLLQALAVQQQSITQAVSQQVQELMGPMQADREAQAYNAGLESATDMLGDNVARFGEFAADPQADKIARERVLDRAEALMPEVMQRFGQNPRAAEIAIQRAADDEREYIRSFMGQGAQQAANRLSTLAGAAAEPGAGAPGAIAGVADFGTDKKALLQHYASNARQIETNGGAAA